MPDSDRADDPLAMLRRHAGRALAEARQRGVRAPDLGAHGAWLNSARALSFERELAGKVVLLHLWSASSSDAADVWADLAWLARRHARQPFVVVGVHTSACELATERAAEFDTNVDIKLDAELDNAREHVRDHVLRHGIGAPIALDVDGALRAAFTALAPGEREPARAMSTARVPSDAPASPASVSRNDRDVSASRLVLVGADRCVLASLAGARQRVLLDAYVAAALELYASEGRLDARALAIEPELGFEVPRAIAYPTHVAVHAEREELWIADTGHHRIVVTDLAGRCRDVIGCGEPELVDGTAERACFREPRGIAFDAHHAFVADTGNHALRRIALSDLRVDTLAARGALPRARRPAARASLEAGWSAPLAVCVRDARLYIAMTAPCALWRYDIESGELDVIGDTRRARAGADGSAFVQPSALCALGERVYAADSASSSVHALDPERDELATLAPRTRAPADAFAEPRGIAAHARELLLADTRGRRVHVLDPRSGAARPLVGRGRAGHDDGAFAHATFAEPSGIAVRGERAWIADASNHAIRVLDFATRNVSTLDLSDVPLVRDAERAALPRVRMPRARWPNEREPRRIELRARPGRLLVRGVIPLRAGERLADGAPALWRWSGAEQRVEQGAIRAARFEFDVDFGADVGAASGVASRTGLGSAHERASDLGATPASTAAAAEFELVVLAYVRDVQARCRVASWRFTLSIAADARAGDELELPSLEESR